MIKITNTQNQEKRKTKKIDDFCYFADGADIVETCTRHVD